MAFITNKTLPRRTFLRGVGATLALPLLESMVPARRSVARAAQASRRRVSSASSCRTARRRATGFRRAASATSSSRSSSSRSQPFREHVVLTSGLWAKSSENPPGVTGADHFVAAAYLCGDEAEEDDRRGHRGRHHASISHRAADRPGDAAAVAAARGRGPGREREQLRRGLQLRLHEHDLVGSRRCGRCRWRSIRRSCSSACSATAARRSDASRAASSSAASSTRSRAASRASKAQVRHVGPRAARSIPARTCARSSGACRSRRRRRPRLPSDRDAVRRAGVVRRAHQAAVRSARARVPGATSRACRRCSTRATSRAACTRRAARTSASTAARTMPKIRAASRNTRGSTGTTCRRSRTSSRS